MENAQAGIHLRPLSWPRDWGPEMLSLISRDKAFDCLVLDRSAPTVAAAAKQSGLHVIQQQGETLAVPSGVTLISDGVWARVVRAREDPTSTEAGPTGLPWIDSNGWRIRLAHAQSPGKLPWVRFSFPPNEVVRGAAYQIAIADCEANGGRWVVQLDRELSTGLAKGNIAAQQTWKAIAQAVAFYRETPSFPELPGNGARMGVLSDFAGDNEFMGHEFLNLIAREYVPVRIFMKTGAPPPLGSLRLVIYLDAQPLPPAWAQALAAFVHAGGTLVTARTADPKLGKAMAPVAGLEYDLRSAGKGRVAVSTEDFDDPWRVAADAHVLLGRANDLIRHANAGAMNITYTASADGRHARLQLVSYSHQRALNPVTLTLYNRYRTALFRSLTSPAVKEVPVAVEYGRTAVYLPHFAICGTVDLHAGKEEDHVDR